MLEKRQSKTDAKRFCNQLFAFAHVAPAPPAPPGPGPAIPSRRGIRSPRPGNATSHGGGWQRLLRPAEKDRRVAGAYPCPTACGPMLARRKREMFFLEHARLGGTGTTPRATKTGCAIAHAEGLERLVATRENRRRVRGRVISASSRRLGRSCSSLRSDRATRQKVPLKIRERRLLHRQPAAIS